MKRRWNWPPLAALNALRILAGQLGRTPTLREIDAAGPSQTVYARLFGSVTNACRMAGLRPNKIGGRYHPMCRRGHPRREGQKCATCISQRNKDRRQRDPAWRAHIQNGVRRWQQSERGRAWKRAYQRRYYQRTKLAILHRRKIA